jgi:hypothetical protein
VLNPEEPLNRPDEGWLEGCIDYTRFAKRQGEHPEYRWSHELCLNLRSPACSVQPETPPFHVTNDTNMTIDAVVTIEIQVAHGANTNLQFGFRRSPIC